MEALGGVDGSKEQLSSRITKLQRKFQQESSRSEANRLCMSIIYKQ